MSNYLLLRNNKQSGPYSLEEIRAMGLKAYDLVWVEGKSAAWRYPGEIEEMKSFAPPVEEQPYDRFFKKPSSENKPVSLTQQATIPTKTEDYHAAAIVREPATAVRETISQPGRPIYVTMPANRKAIPEKEIASVPERKQFAQERARIAEEPEQKTFIRSLPLTTDEPAKPEENFLQPSGNTRNQSGAASLRQKRTAFPDLTSLIRPATIAFGLIALIALGVVIGLLISSRGINSTKNKIPDIESGVPSQQTAYKTPISPASSLPPVQEAGQAASDKGISQTNLSAGRKLEVAGVEKKKAKAVKAPASDSLVAAKPIATDNKDAEALIAHRETGRKTDAVDAKESIKANIMDYVSVGAGKYTVGTFGGISDLQLTVSNRSAYPLDLVLVEVRYILSNKKTFKTENIYFHDIAAGSALMVEAPKSPRGIKVQYRITLINSKELGLSYSDL